jgi:hypothetical protein
MSCGLQAGREEQSFFFVFSFFLAVRTVVLIVA